MRTIEARGSLNSAPENFKAPERTSPETSSNNPLVSVIIPTYNRKTLLGEALQSVWDQQLPKNCGMEIIVVDDGSTDGTTEYLQTLVSQIPTHTVHTEHVGCGCARNAGIRKARGEYLAFLDSDDLLSQGSIAKRLAYLQAHPETMLVYTDERIESGGKPLPKTRFQLWAVDEKTMSRYDRPNFIQPQTPIQFSSVMVRKELFDRVGLFADNLLGHEDSDLCHRIAELAPEQELGHIDEPLTVFRWGVDPDHSLDISNQQAFIDEGRKYLLRYYLDRCERGLTLKEKVLVLKSQERLDAFQEIFNNWRKGLIADEQFHDERQKIFKWVEYK